MKRSFFIALGFSLWCVSQPVWSQTAAQAKAEQYLTALLAPHAKAAAYAMQPVRWKSAQRLEEIALPIQPYRGVPAPLPSSPLKAFKPHEVTRTQPLVAYREAPTVPQEVDLPAQPLVRLPSVDVSQPLPIPILAQPHKDRASLADPTLEASLEAALRPLSPARTQPLPFTPINLPDPFENVRTAQVRHPPEENPVPPVISLPKPTK